MSEFDLTYATVDSLSEGVGSSQIAPLMEKLAIHGMKINLLTFEKEDPPIALKDRMEEFGIAWTQIPFGISGPIGGFARTIQLARLIPDSLITHARSDFPAVAARLSGQKRVLWDVRSLWADQRKFIEESPIKRGILSFYAPLEEMACNSSLALSTLTKAVVPILEDRHKKLPSIRTVVPTAVDLERFKFSPVMPSKLRGLFSGTYNNYYDLDLSRRFIAEMRKFVSCEVGWARPKESKTTSLNAGEDHSFSATQSEMANLMSEYSFGMSICKEDAGPSLKAAMPTKIAEFLAIGRPVVVNAGLGDCDELLEQNGAGIVIKRNDDLEVKAKELIELIHDNNSPQRCRNLAESNFDLNIGVTSYLESYAAMSRI